MKKLLIVLGSLAGILLLALFIAGYFIARFDPNAHKPEIEQAFLAATGRPLHLGNIGLGLWPRLGFSVDQLSVDNAAGFGDEPLLTVGHAQLSLGLWPLLHGQVEIGTVYLSGVHINAQVAADGSNNWTLATAGDTGSASAPVPGAVPANKLIIGGIELSDAQVIYDNRSSKSHYEVKNIDLQIGEINSGNLAEAMQLSPLELLRNFNVQGALAIGKLSINKMQLADIKISLQTDKGVVTLNPVTASLYGGRFNGSLGVDMAGAAPLVKVAATLDKIDIGNLMRDLLNSNYVAGTSTLELALAGGGNDLVTLKRSLNGSGKLLLKQGVLRGVDVGATLTSIETMIRSRKLLELPQGGETQFDNFSATLAIEAGVVSSNDLLVKAPGWQVAGTGTLVDLPRDSLDFNLLATVDPTTATVADQKYDIGGHKLPIACDGSLNSPRCLPDAKAILKDIAAKPARELLDKALNRLLR